MKVTALRTTKLTAARQSMTPSAVVCLQIPRYLFCFASTLRHAAQAFVRQCATQRVVLENCSFAAPQVVRRLPCRHRLLLTGTPSWQILMVVVAAPLEMTGRDSTRTVKCSKPFHCQANPKLPARIMESSVLCQCLKDFEHPDSKEMQRLHAAGAYNYSTFALQSVLSPTQVCGISLWAGNCCII